MSPTQQDGQSSAFSRLHPTIQRELYRMRWTRLRPIQAAAIHALLGAEAHLLISANTAAGKTEAAFLPILSRIVDDYAGGIRALYVSPLKALINDQFRRLEELCARSDIPVHRWHGDVSREKKRILVQHPAGILLITPESIESLFINRPDNLPHIFDRLSYIVIDELHSFMGTERGAHLKSLLARVVCKSREAVKCIGLSATIGEPDHACRWLQPCAPGQVRLITDKGSLREVRFQIRGYLLGDPANTAVGDTDDLPDPEAERFTQELFDCLYGKTALVFANSRRLTEDCADRAKQECRRRGLPDRFLVHHGSLARSVREEAEAALRSDTPVATFCSTTLELGIDVGNVKEVGQINAPWTVSALVQRLGRSGRAENEPSVMRLFLLERKPRPDLHLIEHLHPRLLQAVAMAELMLSHWCEPPDVDRLHLSTLVQQVMSLIAERGGGTAAELFHSLVLRGGFTNVSEQQFVHVLRSMGRADLVEQCPEGPIILGLQGERIVRSHEFYAAFVTAEEFRVVHQGHSIGSVSPMCGLDADRHLVLAGRRWRIMHVSEEEREIIVEPARGARLPTFDGGLGADIHALVREKMRGILCSDSTHTYMDDRAQAILDEARRQAKSLQLAKHIFFHQGNETIWFTWTSSRINRTLAALGRYFGEFDVDDEGIALVFQKVSAGELAEFYGRMLQTCPAPEEIARFFPAKAVEKYDHYLAEELQCHLLAQNNLDVPGAIKHLRGTFGSPRTC